MSSDSIDINLTGSSDGIDVTIWITQSAEAPHICEMETSGHLLGAVLRKCLPATTYRAIYLYMARILDGEETDCPSHSDDVYTFGEREMK